MTEGQMSALGGFYLLVLLGLFIGACVLVNRFFGDRIRYNQRRRQVETAMHLQEFDRRITEGVADEWGYDSRNFRHDGRDYGRRGHR
ncbi:hypothetical protein [Streptomyces brasiliscabiei]|uniref:hypothetical protein n=1 Tax=Streptomyces brasiliscabiei TaxID=2736302 RepID=UPI001C0F671A|nr:hypothetical protein [Streptomyces brasiliscabiei]